MTKPTKFKQTKIGKNKITNLPLFMRCVKKELSFGKKKFKVYVIKDTFARVNLFGFIVNNNFFKDFNKKEQAAILYHEEYHNRFLTSLKGFWNWIRSYLSVRKANWQEEFDADSYAAKKIGKEAVKSFLEKTKENYDQENTAYNVKTHPPIEERIKRMS